MKNLKTNISILLALSIAIGFSACEKNEDSFAPVASKNKTTTANQNKRGSYADVLMDFIESVSEDGKTIDEQIADTALAYTETALNWRLTNTEKTTAGSRVLEYEYEINTEIDGANLKLNPTEIEELNTDLYNYIYNYADTIGLTDYGEGIFISTIDLEWNELSEGSNTIYVTFVINSAAALPPPNCNSAYDWKPIDWPLWI